MSSASVRPPLFRLADTWKLPKYANKTVIDTSGSGLGTGSNHIRWGDSGNKLFLSDGSNVIIELTTTTPYDASTASTTGNSFDFGNDGFAEAGFDFRPDGSQLFVMDGGDDSIYSYPLGTNWDITTLGSFTRQDISGLITDSRKFRVRPDGTQFFVSDGNDDVTAVDMSTAWDVNTATTTSFTTNITFSQDGIYLRNDGNRLYVVEGSTAFVAAFNPLEPWDFSVELYSRRSNDFDTGNSIDDVEFSPDGQYLMLSSFLGQAITQYNV